MSPEAVAALQAPVDVKRSQEVETVPLVPHMGKYAIQASVNGVERSFVFDTGAPTMISQELAEQLDLKVIGENTGRDANGKEFTTRIALVDQLRIGGLTFSDIPVLIADFKISDPNGCFIGAGVIGSNIFPGSVWHIDGEQNVLQIAAEAHDIPGLQRASADIETDLHIDGYPYAPVFDYAFGSFEDRALFDTGNSDTIILFDRVTGDKRVQQAIVAGSRTEGRGSHGVSAAGIGATTDLLRFELDGMNLGSALPRLSATTRNAPPSLIGLGILNRYHVTLDYSADRMMLHERDRPAATSVYPGYGLMMRQGAVKVVQLFEGSVAERAGLRLGDEVVAIDGRDLSEQPGACGVARWLAEDRPTQDASTLTVMRDGAPVEISLQRP
ncbi:aspartyl protease family protein [Pseudoblastomonas halimionae]|nr:aspartyl protease family protein [Alteriqipengyuania halimionae]